MFSEKKVLLLNPPFLRPVLRDYYCAKSAKSDYLIPPTELLVISGILRDDFKLLFRDYIAERKKESACLEEISELRPDAIISVIACLTIREDLAFHRKLREKLPETIMIATGDYCLKKKQEPVKPFDYFILNFMTNDILLLLKNRFYGKPHKYYNILDGKGACLKRKSIDFPVPIHSLFRSRRYCYPVLGTMNFTTVLTSFACPHFCSFCLHSVLSYQERTIDNVIDELKDLKKIGFCALYFADQSFTANRQRVINLLDKMLAENLTFEWVAFARVDELDGELLRLMKKSGCSLLMMGIESLNQQILDRYNKGIKKAQIRHAIDLCRKTGIRTMGTFIFGLEGSSFKENYMLPERASKLGLDFASFNFLVPRVLTQVRNSALSEKSLSEMKADGVDQSGKLKFFSFNSWITENTLNYFGKRAIFKFYLRPGYLFKRLSGMRTFTELFISLKMVLGLFK